MSGYPIVVRGLTRYFDAKRAVHNIHFAVPRGSVLALIGRNGAGKTTTLRMMLGLLEPSAGSAELLGEDSSKLSPDTRGRIGYMAEGAPLLPWMRVSELVDFQAGFYAHFNRPLCSAVLDAFGLLPASHIRSLSEGQRAGLSLALTLAPEPEVLLLDDPAMGLDPVARRLVLEAMVHFAQQKDCTTVFSSHLLADVERVCDAVAVLDSGELRVCCPIESFRDGVRQYVLSYRGEKPELPSIDGLLRTQSFDSEIHLTVSGESPTLRESLLSLGQVEEFPLSFEDAAIAFLSEPGETQFQIPGAA